jgi:drug/metabolite transporter (DMT)-like permease
METAGHLQPVTPRAGSPAAAGILLYIAAIFTMATMDMTAKTLSAHVPVLEVVWARYAGQTLIVIALLSPRLKTAARTRHPWLQLLRACFMLGATSLFFTAISQLGLAEAAALMEINPMLITLGAALFLHERVGAHRAAGIGAALIGALIIIRPGSAVFVPAALLPLAGAACYAGFALVTRFIGRHESTWTLLFYAGLPGALVLSLAVPAVWVAPDRTALGLMVAVAALGALGQFLVIRALTLAEASIVAPFSYAGLIFAAFWGWSVFSDIPDTATLAGAAVIVAAGLYVWYRETRRRRAG